MQGDEYNNEYKALFEGWEEKNNMLDVIDYLDDVAYDMDALHLHNVEHNLFLASTLG